MKFRYVIKKIFNTYHYILFFLISVSMSSYMKKHVKLSNCYTCSVGPNSMTAPLEGFWFLLRDFIEDCIFAR
jgi:hypothetical protein